MVKEVKYYGTVEGMENVSFVLDNYQCTFFGKKMSKAQHIIIKNEQGYIQCLTVEGKSIYIYSGKDIEFYDMTRLNTWHFLVGNRNNIKDFRGIVFKKGVLDKLFLKNYYHFANDNIHDISIDVQDDYQSYNLKIEKIKGLLKVGSGSIQRYVSAEEGLSVHSTGTEFEMIFDEEKELKSFIDIYGYVLRLCQFMMFRRNIKFEKILLYTNCKQNTPIHYDEIEVFVKGEGNSYTNRSIFECITFNILGVTIIELLESIVKNSAEHPFLNIGFIPENDSDAMLVTRAKIREVCSSLESEMELASIHIDQDEEFNKLVNELKKKVKEHKGSSDAFTNTKSYDYILGTLKHMQASFSDRIEICFMKYQHLFGEYISRPDIDKFVKYRNSITHGNYMELDQNLVETMFILMKLDYCCVLKRIGMEDKDVKDIMNRRLID